MPNTCARSTAIDDASLNALRQRLADPLPHPDLAALRSFGGDTLDWLLHHFATLPEQSIGRTASRLEMEVRLREPAPEHGSDFPRVLAEFEEKVAPFAFRVNHPRFLAFVPGAPTFLSVLGDLLIAGTNFFAGVWLEAAGPAQVELVVLDWFKEFLGLPASAGGVLTGGGSEANLIALLAARETHSFADRQRAVLYLTGQRHWSIDRAARVMGLHPDQVCVLPADSEGRLQPATLAEAIQRDRAQGRMPWAAVANGGATNTGVVDPLAELAALCRGEGVWLHVDAAYGWPAVLTTDGRAELNGIESADSVTLDPHKWFAQTFEAGCVLLRDSSLLERTFALRPEYMQDVEPAADEVNFCDRGLALTRRFRALKIWLSLKVLGVAWYRRLVEHCCGLATFAEELLRRSADFEVVSPRRLSIVCFGRRLPGRSADEVDRLNLRLAEELRETGRAFLSTTRLHGRVALRFCFINWRTTTADVEQVVRLLHELVYASRS